MIKRAEDDFLDEIDEAAIEAWPQHGRAEAGQQQRQHHDEGGTQEGTANTREAADDDDEKDLEGAVEIEAVRLDRAQIGEGPEHTGDADIEAADSKDEKLRAQHLHAEHPRGEFAVADRDQRPPGLPRDQTHGDEGEHRDDAEAKKIAPHRRIERHAADDASPAG